MQFLRGRGLSGVGGLGEVNLIFKEELAPVVQRPDNFIRWIRHYSGSKLYFTFNVVHGFHTLPNLAVVGVCIFTCTQGNTENLFTAWNCWIVTYPRNKVFRPLNKHMGNYLKETGKSLKFKIKGFHCFLWMVYIFDKRSFEKLRPIISLKFGSIFDERNLNLQFDLGPRRPQPFNNNWGIPYWKYNTIG